MDVTPLITRDRKIIQSYKSGVFKINGEVFNHPVIVMPERVLEWPFRISGLALGTSTTAQGSRIEPEMIVKVEDFALLQPFLNEIDVILFGTGGKQIILPSALRQAIKAAYGFTVEPMDTGAASRTYNVLMAEGRKIAAALL